VNLVYKSGKERKNIFKYVYFPSFPSSMSQWHRGRVQKKTLGFVNSVLQKCGW